MKTLLLFVIYFTMIFLFISYFYYVYESMSKLGKINLSRQKKDFSA